MYLPHKIHDEQDFHQNFVKGPTQNSLIYMLCLAYFLNADRTWSVIRSLGPFLIDLLSGRME